jgi:cytochrome c oxidase subunit 4
MAEHGHTSKYKPGEIAWGAEHHIQPVSTYLKTIVGLFILMLATIGFSRIAFPDVSIAGHVLPGTFINNIIAMTIACMKAILVMLFFMHLKISTPLTKFWAAMGFIWVVLIFFIMVDYATRPLDPTIARPWMSDPGSSMPKYRGGPQSEDADPNLNVNIRPRQ